MKKIHIGQLIGKREFVGVDSGQVQVPDPARLVHLQFRRFAGCPFCSMHLGSVMRRHDEIAAAGIREVVVFRSTPEEIQRHQVKPPFAVVADPQEKLFAEFGVASGLRAVLNPRVWGTAVRSVIRMFPKLPVIPPKGHGMLGLPADFLIATDGRVLACKYGIHAYDQWSVDELLALARQHAGSSAASG